MDNLPSTADPLDLDILALLTKLPTIWSDICLDELSSTAARALGLAIRAGWAEGRARWRLTMDGYPEIVRLQLCVSGDYGGRELSKVISDAFPAPWLDAEGRTRGKVRIEANGVHQVRLTDQGEIARRDIASGLADCVVNFARKRGVFQFRPRVTPQIHVEQRLVETGSADVAQPQSVAVAQATAHASVGDVVVHNHVEIDAGQLLVQLQSMLAKAAPASTPPTETSATAHHHSIRVADAEPDPHDDRFAWLMGKRIYLGKDTQIARLFWLMVTPVGRRCFMDEVQKAVDGMSTSREFGHGPEEVALAEQRVRKAVSKLRERLREADLDQHFVIHRGGESDAPEYTMVRHFP